MTELIQANVVSVSQIRAVAYVAISLYSITTRLMIKLGLYLLDHTFYALAQSHYTMTIA